jgi:hypothetical protein
MFVFEAQCVFFEVGTELLNVTDEDVLKNYNSTY